MTEHETDILIVGGGAAGLSAAAAAADSADARVAIVDDNPRLGGQIWRAELGRVKSPDAARLIAAVEGGRIEVINNAQVFAASGDRTLCAETPEGRLDLHYQTLIIATGARERFLPFPGWTLPNVFGAGGLQALVKGGVSLEGKRVVVAGTGPLLLVVAEFFKRKGGTVITIAEQADTRSILGFGFHLWSTPSKVGQAVALKARLRGIKYHTSSWIISAEGADKLQSVTISTNGSLRTVDCDYLACGYHLVPNLELADLLGCGIEQGYVAVDEYQHTSRKDVYCAGEPTLIAGVESSLLEGRIAGLAAAGNLNGAKALFRKRDKARRFGRVLNETFQLRDELKTLAEDNTVICRCEDVTYGRLSTFDNVREAKLQTRCGMGSCQGRVCGAAAEFLFGWKRGTVRPPLFPVRIENL